MRRLSIRGVILLLVALTSACAGAVGDSPAAPTQQPTSSSGGTGGGGGTTGGGAPALTITVTATGLSPQDLTIPVGSKVTFTNADTRPHDFSGGPDPSHPECPEIDVAGFVAAGQSRDTGTFTVARSCQFHDHTFIGVPAFMGRIVIQ
ncbi:MAG: hypothetical protein U0P30_18325 [Vicinamibacterales bacterium]